jgi:hypothetical protein
MSLKTFDMLTCIKSLEGQTQDDKIVQDMSPFFLAAVMSGQTSPSLVVVYAEQ